MNKANTIALQNQRIEELENKLRSEEAYRIYKLHFAPYTLDKLSTVSMYGSGVITGKESAGILDGLFN